MVSTHLTTKQHKIIGKTVKKLETLDSMFNDLIFKAWTLQNLWLRIKLRDLIGWPETMQMLYRLYIRIQVFSDRSLLVVHWIYVLTEENSNLFAKDTTFVNWFTVCSLEIMKFSQPFSKLGRSRCSHFLSVCYLANAIFKHKLFPAVPCQRGCIKSNRLPVTQITPYGSKLVQMMHIGQDVPEE